MKIPCKQCLLIPICRHKSYHALVEECTLAFKYLRLSEDEIVNHSINDCQTERIIKVEELINPTRWQLIDKKSYTRGTIYDEGTIYDDKVMTRKEKG